MTTILKAIVCTLPLLAACSATPGSRCNPAQYANDPAQGDCESGYACVYPTAPSCGTAYCCKVDGDGRVIDGAPTCQPDPTLRSACMPDLAPADGGESD